MYVEWQKKKQDDQKTVWVETDIYRTKKKTKKVDGKIVWNKIIIKINNWTKRTQIRIKYKEIFEKARTCKQ
jgi:hypothetical protein